MEGPIETDTLSGKGKRYPFFPPYVRTDFIKMQKLLDDSTMNGWAAVRLIHDDCITVTTVGE